MADEGLQYASGGADTATNKRKYDDQTTPSPASSGGRRATGFSAPIASQSPPDFAAPPSYNTVPPPVNDFQLAKQKAQEIAARLLNSAEAKRPRVENGGSGFDSNENKGFSSGLYDQGQKPNIAPSMGGSFGYTTGRGKVIEIPNGRVGVVIGKSGETIKYLQLQSGAKIQVTRDSDVDPGSLTRGVELVGTPEAIAKAEQLIQDVLAEAEAGGSALVSRRLTGQQSGAEKFVMRVPNNKVGLVIGKGGETIKNMQATSGARIQVIPLHLPPGDTSTERTVQIDGTSEQIEIAKQLISEVTSENRVRNPTMSSYSQQAYQAPQAGSWAPPAPPMQQPGYGYHQPGAPQYNMTQPSYTTYPTQPASAGYGTGWDQTAQSNQQAGGGYDYYNQQPPPAQQQQQQQQTPGATTDSTAYSYNQPPAYTQDGYGSYHAPTAQAGYAQPQPNSAPIYNQQQGYTYGNVTNPTPEVNTPSYGAQGDNTQTPPPVKPPVAAQQGYSTGPLPSPNSNYPPQPPPQASSQPSYGLPPPPQSGYATSYVQKPPTSQPSPTAQGGSYVQPYSQPPPAQAGYPQPVQPGYAVPPYPTQASYVSQPPPYGAYGATSYSQPPPVYSADTAPTSQASNAAKASPPS